MKVVYDLVNPSGALTDGWPGTMGLFGGDTFKGTAFDRTGGELRWEAIPVKGGLPRMWPWWTTNLTAEEAHEHVHTWSEKLGREDGTFYVMWCGLKSYDVALFWVPDHEPVEGGGVNVAEFLVRNGEVGACNPEAPPWA